MFAKFALDAAGRAMFYTNVVSNADYIAGQAYLMEAACVDTDIVASDDAFNGGFRYTSLGALKVYDATAGVPAGSNTNRGVMCTSDGQVCYTTDAIGSDVAYYNGIALDTAGRVFATLITPAAWFRYAQGITEAGQGVSVWADQSGNSRDLKQGTDGARPAKQSDGSILFNGTDEYLKCDAFTLNQPETVYILFKSVTATAADTVFDGNVGNTMRLYQSINADPTLVATSDGTALISGSLALDSYGVVCAVYNGASGVLRVNNAADVTGSVGAGNAGGFTLGAFGTISAWANIQVKEVAIFPAAHDANTRLHTIRYLQRVGALWP